MHITNCKVNHLTDPLGFSLDKPVFSWTAEDAAGKRQAAARIVIKHCEDVEADTGWADLDSLASSVELTLRPRTRYTWTVSVRTDAGEEAESKENWFETGKMEEPWAAKWIGCDDTEPRHPVFSREIIPAKPVRSARLYICGLGLYEAAWNGEKIGGEMLAPYCTDYNNWVQYQTYDITQQMQGAGVLSITLGNGWYKGRFGFDDHTGKPYYGDSWKLLGEVRLFYADGTEETIGTDGSWSVTRSKITFSNIYDGERRDDTLPEIQPVPAALAEPPAGRLTARYSTPVEIREELPARELVHTPAGEAVLDLGQNLAGIFRLRVQIPAGEQVHLQFGEILQNGNFYRDNLRTAKAEYLYVSDGQPHTVQPKFTFYGYRYVKVEGIPDLKPEDFTALVLYSDIPSAGSLTTGNELVNRLISNVEWGQKGNFLDVPTDCPQRDERMGWTGDAQVFAPTACYLRDSWAFFAKYLHDMAMEQEKAGGEVPNVVPSFGYQGSSAAWGDAACMIPWTLYEFYGDKSILERQYGSMTAWVDWIARIDGADHGWRWHFHFGDWLALDAPNGDPGQMRGATDEGFIADVYYRRSALLCSKAARVLGRENDAARYAALADHILTGIREEYFSVTGRCCIPTQTAALLTLDEGLHDQARARELLAQQLEQSGGKLKTGFVGTPLLCRVLCENGMEDRAFDLLLNEDYPGWLHEVKLGATTVWERWNSVDPDGSISSTGMNSLNHYAYGSILAWVWQYCAGLRPSAPGFRRAVIRPVLNWKLRHVEAEYRSAAGTYRVSWRLMDRQYVDLTVAVPFGCAAELTLPLSGQEPVTLEAGQYRYDYETTQPVGCMLSTGDSVKALLSHPGAKKLLLEMLPGIGQLPPSMQSASLRDLAAKMGKVDEKQLALMDAALAEL